MRSRPHLLFAHRLALALGHVDVEKMLAAVSASQFRQWMRYASIEPFGYDIENWRHAMVASTVANFSGRLRKGAWTKPKDFFPKIQPKQSWRQMKALFKQAFMAAKAVLP